MPEYDFSQVDAAIIDSQYGSQRVFREVLIRLGMKTVTTFASLQDAVPVLTKTTPDLILIDADGNADDTEAFRFVRTLRNEPGSPNPYTCLIVTTFNPTPTLLLRVSNSGADNLLVKPVSPKQVQDRVANLIEGRKSFVVTSEYTGPDRRKSPREGAQVPLIDVPNTLRMKATGKWANSNLRQMMQIANVRVNEQKRLRASVQAAFLIEFAVPGLRKDPPERMALEHLVRVPAVMDDLVRRLLDGGGPESPAGQMCRSIKELVENVRSAAESGSIDSEDLSRAQALARDLMQAVDPNRPPESLSLEVANAVGAYRYRLEQITQAKAAEAARAAEAPAAEAVAK